MGWESWRVWLIISEARGKYRPYTCDIWCLAYDLRWWHPKIVGKIVSEPGEKKKEFGCWLC